jgi:hypothetical protein
MPMASTRIVILVLAAFRCNAWGMDSVLPYDSERRGGKEAKKTVNKKRIALWAAHNPRARKLIIRGLKNRRVRGMAWAAAKRGIRR